MLKLRFPENSTGLHARSGSQVPDQTEKRRKDRGRQPDQFTADGV